MNLPDLPARCVACPSEAVHVVTIDGHEVWCCQECESLILRPAGVVTGSRDQVLA